MGFGGGGSNVTLAHTHSSAIVQDGGALDFDDVTQASGAAGDITFSDGNALQLLNVGSAADVLTVNGAGTAPEWAAPASGGATMTRTLVAYSTAQSTSSASLVSLTGLQHTCTAGAGHAILLFNGIVETDESFAFNWAFSVDANPTEVAGKASPVGVKPCNYTAVTETLSSQTVDLQYRVKNPAGTATMQVDNTNSNFYILEIA